MCYKCLWYESYYGFMFALHIVFFSLISLAMIQDVKPIGIILGLFVVSSIYLNICRMDWTIDTRIDEFLTYAVNKLKLNRQDKPGKFCVITSGVLLVLAIIGKYISGTTVLGYLILTGLLVHGYHLFMNMRCIFEEDGGNSWRRRISRISEENEYDLFLPETPNPSSSDWVNFNRYSNSNVDHSHALSDQDHYTNNNNNNNNNNIIDNNSNNNNNKNDNQRNYEDDDDTNENISDEEIPQDLLMTDSLPGFNDISSSDSSNNDADDDDYLNDDHNNIPGGIYENSSSDDDSIIKSLRFNDDIDGGTNISGIKSTNVPKSNKDNINTNRNLNNNNNNNSHNQIKMKPDDKPDVYDLEECPTNSNPTSSSSSSSLDHKRGEQPEKHHDVIAIASVESSKTSEQLRNIISSSILAAVIQKTNDKQSLNSSLSSSSSDEGEFEFISSEELNQFAH